MLFVLDLRSCLLCPGPLHFLTFWTSDALTQHALTHCSCFCLLICLVSLTNKQDSLRFIRKETPRWLGFSFSHHHPYHFQICPCSPLMCAQPNISISRAHVDIRRSLPLCSCLCMCLSITAHAFNQAISGLYTVPSPLVLSCPPSPELTAAGETAHWRHAVVEM